MATVTTEKATCRRCGRQVSNLNPALNGECLHCRVNSDQIAICVCGHQAVEHRLNSEVATLCYRCYCIGFREDLRRLGSHPDEAAELVRRSKGEESGRPVVALNCSRCGCGMVAHGSEKDLRSLEAYWAEQHANCSGDIWEVL